jgi:hypothetical protein
MSTIPTYMTFKGVKTPGSGIIKTGVAASEIPFGAFVTRSADGTIKAQVTNVPYTYLGVAVDDQRQQMPYDGFYAAARRYLMSLLEPLLFGYLVVRLLMLATL